MPKGKPPGMKPPGVIERLILEGSDISTLKMHTFSSMTYKRLLRAAMVAKSPQRTLHASAAP
jgi:hypothetical protein